MKILQTLKRRAGELNAEVYALYLAYKHPEVPWAAKVIVAFTIAYALSPIDLIPDFIPVFGFLDDLLIVPAGIALSLRLIPKPVMQECRSRAVEEFAGNKPVMRNAWLIVVFTWLVFLSIGFMFVYKFYSKDPTKSNL